MSDIIQVLANCKLFLKIKKLGERPYKCEQCSSDFAIKKNLKRHQQIHADSCRSYRFYDLLKILLLCSLFEMFWHENCTEAKTGNSVMESSWNYIKMS